MTLQTPVWLQNGTYPARIDRIFADVLFGEGVMAVSAGDLRVTQRGAGANVSVDIAAGRACITGDDTADQGNYLVRNDGTVNLVMPAAPGANKRIDVVFVRVNDPAAGGPAGDNATFGYVSGAVAAAPTPPATPTSAIALAQVLRTAGDVSITNAMITDVRAQALTILNNTLTTDGDLFTRAGGSAARIGLGASGLPLVAGVSAPAYSQLTSTGIASGAVTTAKLATGAGEIAGSWTTFTQATARNPDSNITGLTMSGAYLVIGKTVHIRYGITAGTATGGGTVRVGLPTAIGTTIGTIQIANSLLIDGGITRKTVSSRMEPSSLSMTFWADSDGTTFVGGASIASTHAATFEIV